MEGVQAEGEALWAACDHACFAAAQDILWSPVKRKGNSMHDIRAIRDNPEAFDKAMSRRKLSAQSPAILNLDKGRRELLTTLQTLQSERNDKSAQIGKIKKEGGDAQTIMAEVAALKELRNRSLHPRQPAA